MKNSKFKYRIKQFDVINDIYFLQKKSFLFWKNIGVGSLAKLKSKKAQLEK